MAITIDGSAGTIAGIGTDGFSAGTISTASLASGNIVSGSKMGYAGAVVQTQVLNSTTRATAASSSMAEVSSSYRVSITPLFSNSVMLISYHIPTGWGTDWAANYVMRVSAKRFVSGTAQDISSVGVTNGSRTLVAGYHQRPGNGYDYNDMEVWAYQVIDLPNTTSTIQYGFYASQEGGTVYYGYSRDGNGSWGWDANIVIMVQEIKQ